MVLNAGLQSRNTQVNIAEMRMLRWMGEYMRKNKMRKEYNCEKVEVASIEDKLRKSRLK
ncbi:hypothetical protein AXF42_Ash012532 [Apostasia shenzhenica]|uniref:Uncharacterized protein n=1 Tax=Apostasia shenzhenica TaxID=1088818 RepID=A0A2I0AR11_9ASPA|nr:hypothetical protein AXF42_Ash012532 [Apostasia shenzhenica]